MNKSLDLEKEIQDAREKWLNAKRVSNEKSLLLFNEGSGILDPIAINQAEQEVHNYRLLVTDAYEYLKDLEKKEMDCKILKLQKSQTCSTWVSTIFGIIVGLSTIVSIIL